MIYSFITAALLAETKAKVVEALFLFDKIYGCSTDKENFPNRSFFVENFHGKKSFEQASDFFWHTIDILSFYDDLLSYAEHADTARIVGFANKERPTESELGSLLVIQKNSGFPDKSTIDLFSKNLRSQAPRVLSTGLIAPSEEMAKQVVVFINDLLDDNKKIISNLSF